MRFTSLICVMAMTITLNGTVAFASEEEGWARVIGVTEQREQVNEPRRECSTRTEQVAKERGMSGSIVGGILGGVAGHQVGSGRGNTAATVAGAIGGAIAGDKIQNKEGYEAKEVEHCRTVDEYHSKVSGYQVTYKYKGSTYTDVLPTKPTANRIRVRASITPVQL